jgi:hypothetical protein
MPEIAIPNISVSTRIAFSRLKCRSISIEENTSFSFSNASIASSPSSIPLDSSNLYLRPPVGAPFPRSIRRFSSPASLENP